MGRLGTHFRTQPGHHATAHLVLKHDLNHGAAESVFDSGRVPEGLVKSMARARQLALTTI